MNEGEWTNAESTPLVALLDAARKIAARGERVDRRPVGTVVGMALPLGVGDQVPTRLMVFPLGEPPSNDERKWRFTKADLERAVLAFKARTEPMPILYDHGNDPAKGAKAAGWVDSVELAADGLYANVRWTESARQEIRSGEWGFRSPGWEGEEDPLGFVYAGPLNELSLVNKPAIGGMMPVTASTDSPSTPLGTVTAPSNTAGKETIMADATTVTAAKKAAALDKAGILEAIKAKFPGSETFGDETLSKFIVEALSASDTPADPMMPGASTGTPAVPALAAAEDVAKAASATAQANELKAAKEQLATQEARIKALEARELSGKIVNASAADRTKPGTLAVPDAPSPGDFVGASIAAYQQDRGPVHQAAIAYRDKARANGQNVSYRDAVVAVTRRKSA